MFLISWLRNRKPATRQSHRFHPRLEVLEGRAVPATLKVTTLQDVVDPGDGLLSLREAVLQANVSPGPDTIALPAGQISLTGGALDIRDSLSINGIWYASSIDSPHDRVFQVFNTSLSISGLSRFAGEAVTQGGAIYAVSSDVTIANVGSFGGLVFQPGAADALGGAIYAVSSNVMITNSGVFGNAASRGGLAAGGAVYMVGGNLTIANSYATGVVGSVGPFSGARGGGVYAEGATVQISNSTFDICRADSANEALGGSIYASGGSLKISRSIIEEAVLNFGFDTLGTTSGAGVYLIGVAAEFHNVTFLNNIANGAASTGGALYVASGTVEITNSSLAGGGVALSGNDVYIALGASVCLDQKTLADYPDIFGFYTIC